jgi:hypothetical protein
MCAACGCSCRALISTAIYYERRKGNCGAITEPDLFSPHVIDTRAEELFAKRRSDAICPLVEMPVEKDVHSSLPGFQTVSYNSFDFASCSQGNRLLVHRVHTVSNDNDSGSS